MQRTWPVGRVFHLCYWSRVSFGGEPEAVARELRRLLAISRARNAALGVTGLLVCGRRHFAQQLEGSWDVVDRLFRRIAADPRHQEVQVLETGWRPERAFGNWSMGFLHRPDGREIRLGPPPCAPGGGTLRGQGATMVELLRFCAREGMEAG